MDDTKQYKIQVKGTAYTFKPFPDEDIVKIQLVFNMNASPMKTIKAVTKILKSSAGPEQWDVLTDLLIEDKVALEDLVKMVKEILKRQAKDRAPAPPADE